MESFTDVFLPDFYFYRFAHSFTQGLLAERNNSGYRLGGFVVMGQASLFFKFETGRMSGFIILLKGRLTPFGGDDNILM